MEIAGFHHQNPNLELEPSDTMPNWNFCRLPFCQSSNNNAAADDNRDVDHLNPSSVVSSVAKSLLPTRRRLDLDPPTKLYFPYEPGTQVKSAVRIKNVSNAYVAFKFQTTVPKSCYMTPPGGILPPDGSLIATVFKFVEPAEDTGEKTSGDGMKNKAKFKILSLKVKKGIIYIPELFDEQKDQVTVEQVLRVVYLEPNQSCPAMEKLNRQVAEAEADLEARRKKYADKKAPGLVGDGPVLDEWRLRREKYLAEKQQMAENEIADA